jgi:hypothetical protein
VADGVADGRLGVSAADLARNEVGFRVWGEADGFHVVESSTILISSGGRWVF